MSLNQNPTPKKDLIMKDGYKPILPGAEIALIFLNHSSRQFNLSHIPRTPGWCKWCRHEKTKTKQFHYCSSECEVSAEIFCYPQRYCARIFLLKRQGGRCARCRCDAIGASMEVDHIIPIYKGGEALGTDNTQMLCDKCHKIKTSEDRKQ